MTPQLFLVEGEAAVREYLRHRPKAVVQILAVGAQMTAMRALVAAQKLSIPVRERTDKDDEASTRERRSPVAAQVRLKCTELAVALERLDRSPDVLLALDHVQDPRNLGAIARSAAFFGIKALIVPERRQALLTPAAVATAQGGFALTDLVAVVNLGRAVDELKERGYWIVGLDMRGEPLAEVAGAYEKVLLVLGNEEIGLSEKVRKGCDRLVGISGYGGLDSLNVSVAAGIALHAFAGRQARGS